MPSDPHHPSPPASRRLPAILQALLVTFLWSTSWVLIKLGLQASLPALTFAGLRYSLAFACLLPLALANPAQRQALRAISPAGWRQLVLLGVVYYSLTQGAQFVSLAFLPAATLTLIFNFTPLLVALAGGLLQHEAPGRLQWAGMLLCLVGAGLYFLPLFFVFGDAPGMGLSPGVSPGQALGYLAAFIGLLANAASALLGRRANTRGGLSPLLVTTTSMGIGGLLLLLLGALTQGFGEISLAQALIIAWLALVNTAFAFTLWNRTLRTLTAVESSILNGMMLPQIALLAWVFLGEALSARQITGLLLVGGGTLVVQLAPLWRQPHLGTRRAAHRMKRKIRPN